MSMIVAKGNSLQSDYPNFSELPDSGNCVVVGVVAFIPSNSTGSYCFWPIASILDCPKVGRESKLALLQSFSSNPIQPPVAMRPYLKWLKFAIPIIILPWLFWQVDQEQLTILRQQPKNWWLLSAATVSCAVALCVSFLRWMWIVRGVGIDLRPTDAIRLGFIGQILGMVSPGSVGGDLFKAIAVARQKKHSGASALASVLVDRAVGLYGLVLLSTLSLALMPSEKLTPLLSGIRNAGIVLCIVGALGLGLTIIGGRTFDWMENLAQRFPYVGGTMRRLVGSLRVFEGRPSLVVFVLAMSLVVHSALACSFYMISAGLYTNPPTFLEHVQVVPSGMVAGALPIAPAGLGVQELALVEMFKQLPDVDDKFSGLAVAAAYRIVTIFVSLIGLIYYFTSQIRIGEKETEELKEELAEGADVKAKN